MKQLNFKCDSWHYKLAKFVGYYIEYDSDEQSGDICGYTRAVLFGCMLFLLGFGCMVVLLMGVVHLLMGLAFSLAYGAWIMTTLGEITLFFSIVGLSLAISTIVMDKLHKWINTPRNHHKASVPDGFIKSAYKSWKNKYCVRIKFD